MRITTIRSRSSGRNRPTRSWRASLDSPNGPQTRGPRNKCHEPWLRDTSQTHVGSQSEGVPSCNPAETTAYVDDLTDAADAAFDGDGDTLQETDEAVRLYTLACAHGSSYAHLRLGMIYKSDDDRRDV